MKKQQQQQPQQQQQQQQQQLKGGQQQQLGKISNTFSTTAKTKGKKLMKGQLVQISKTSSTTSTTTSTTGKRKRQLNEQQQGKPSNPKRSKNITPLFPDSYASFGEIPENFRTEERDSYLIYYNLLNRSWWYYPSYNIPPGRGGHGDVLRNVRGFPYHESAIYFYLMRDDLFYVRVSFETNHEILTYIMGWGRPDEPIQTQRTYTLNFSRAPGDYNSAWEFINNIQTNNRDIQGLSDLLLPFDEVHRQRREALEQQARLAREQQRERRQQRERLDRERRQRARVAREQRQLQQQQRKNNNNPQGGD